MGALEYWPCNLHVMHNLSDDYLKNANSNKQKLEFAAACSNSPYLSKPPLQASITKKGWSLAPSSCFGEEDASQVQTSSVQTLWCISGNITDELEHTC